MTTAQPTGVLATNGTEIQNGDIIRRTGFLGAELFQVFWCEISQEYRLRGNGLLRPALVNNVGCKGCKHHTTTVIRRAK